MLDAITQIWDEPICHLYTDRWECLREVIAIRLPSYYYYLNKVDVVLLECPLGWLHLGRPSCLMPQAG